MTNTPEFLTKRCDDIVAGAGAAVAWVADARASSQRLDRDADGLTERLRRSRNLCRRLGAAAARPMSVGFFGLSQAGKSYLISALARGANGYLETVLDGQRLDFISHINPPGGGKEATGLVTRFTRQAPKTTPGHPIRLTLFSEADLVKILGNSFFNDFDRERVVFNTDADHIRGHLAALEGRRQSRPTGGIDEDAMVDLMDYFEKRYKKSMEALAGDFWPTAIALAPYLLAPDRARLFSVLWGEIDDLSQTYLRLRAGLDSVGHARVVHAPLSALVKPAAAGWSQMDSIMNVDILERFGKDDADRLAVLPLEGDRPRAEVTLPRSLLAALTMELVFPLAEAPQAKMLEQVDLIDFPGYRGRLAVTNLDEVRKVLEGADPVAGLILRGKVAYLFERYTDDQEMNVLVLCTPCDKQIEVNSLGPALESWINSTQGETPGERAQRQPGLLWAITMFDKRLAPKPGESEDNLRIGWDGMMRFALLERFETSKWLQEWANGRSFDNLFLVRKPGMAAGVINTDAQGRENGLAAGQADRLAGMRRTFVGGDTVRKHVASPEQAWDAMMALDDGGLSRITGYLEGAALLDHKLARIREQLDRLTQELIGSQLGGYFRADGADEVERKRRIVELVLGNLRRRPTSFGELLRALQPSPDHLRSLYLRSEAGPDEPVAATAVQAPPDGGLISLDLGFDDDAPAASARQAAVPAAGGRAARFARAAISDWIKQLRQLPDSTDMHRLLGMTGEVLQAAVDELITGAARHRLEDKVVGALTRAENQAATTRARLADQQVLVACALIDDYVDYLGFSEQPYDRRPASVVTKGRPVFAPPAPIGETALPELSPKQLNYPAIYIVDWFEAFRATAIGNAGHAAGSEIDAEQNQRLGAILGQIAGASLGLAAT